MVGTDQRNVLLCNRKAKNPNERIGAVFSDHLGCVYALQRNPFFPKNFLTVADWQARVGCKLTRQSFTYLPINGGLLNIDLVRRF
jgi:dynein intermediate chain 2